MIITSSKAVSNLFFIMAILFLISCASHHKPNDEISYQYKCVDGGEFTAIVHQDKDQTIIRMGENQYILDITPSASGSKYSDGMNTFWSKGNEAMLELSDGKSYKECEVVE